MTDEITCPADGCEYSGPAKSVAGHAQAKRDPPHKGISYRDVMDEHAGNGASSPSTPNGSSSPSGSGSNPTVGDGDSGGGADGREELPCGHESFDPAEAPATPFTISCETCGKTWRVEDD